MLIGKRDLRYSDLRSSIGDDQWSIDSRDGTFSGRCGRRASTWQAGVPTREDSMNPKETSGTLFSSCPYLMKRPSHGPWSCLGHKRSTKRAGVKVKGPTIAMECHRIVNEIYECVSGGSTCRVASSTAAITSGFCQRSYRMRLSTSSKRIISCVCGDVYSDNHMQSTEKYDNCISHVRSTYPIVVR